MNKIFQLLLVAYLACYLSDNRNDELTHPSVRRTENAASDNISAAKISGFKAGGTEMERDLMNEYILPLRFAGGQVAVRNSNNAIIPLNYKNATAATANFTLPIHLRVN